MVDFAQKTISTHYSHTALTFTVEIMSIQYLQLIINKYSYEPAIQLGFYHYFSYNNLANFS